MTMSAYMNAPLAETDPQIAELIAREEARQDQTLELIASENHVSKAVLQAAGTVFTNKYAEGYPGKRYYGGCVNMDGVEELARERIKQLFGAEHANVQPHSGASANIAVFMATVQPGDTVLGLDLAHGGHLSHGMKLNFSGAYFNVVSYGVNRETERIDMDEVRKLAHEYKPKLIIAGFSAYSRTLDFAAFAEIAKEVGAALMADIAHIAGLVAVGLQPSPIGLADYTTTTTHKTLRGPRGGLIMTSSDNAKLIDRCVFPGSQGGPLMHIVTAKAVAFGEALKPEFKTYQEQIVKNAASLAQALTSRGYRLVAGGTDNHLMLVDLRNVHPNLTGAQAEKWLESANIITNKNMIPFDERKPMETSGLRIGSPALTTRGLMEADMETVAELIHDGLSAEGNDAKLANVRERVLEVCKSFPLGH